MISFKQSHQEAGRSYVTFTMKIVVQILAGVCTTNLNVFITG